MRAIRFPPTGSSTLAMAWLIAMIAAGPVQSQAKSATDLLVDDCKVGSPGGRFVTAQRAEPKTLNPVFAMDAPSREVVRLMTADLIHINRHSQKTEPALAKSWKVSDGGRRYTLLLRRGLRFSDGQPMDAEDVTFTFHVHLDDNTHSPQRDLLLIGGKPIRVTARDRYSVQFDLPEPYAAAERLFDSIAILPRHLLEKAYAEGKLAQVWGLTTSPGEIAGMGPFRLKKYVPGDRVILERNPYYWKVDSKGTSLPYLDQIVLLFVGSEDAQVIRFQAGETDAISRISPENYLILSREQTKSYQLYDLGPGLESDFLFFNLNELGTGQLPEIARKQAWFRQESFRQAVSAAIDRQAIVRLVYQRRAVPLWGNVTPGNKLWLNTALAQPGRATARARELLASAGFKWKADGTLADAAGQTVEFTIATSAGNVPRMQIATMLQADLKELGMKVHVAALEFRSLLDRILKTSDYEACVLSLGSGDADPNSEMNVLLSGGGTHLWHTSQKQPATLWEAEIDRLMKQQVGAVDYRQRKRLYDRVQVLMSEKLPLIYLASPNVLVGARKDLGNIKPAILDPYVLWNAEELYWCNGDVQPSHN